MKVRVAVTVCAVALAMSACNGGEAPVETVTPTPWAGSTTAESTPTPTATPTPTQEELSAMAEQTYRTFFNEWVRLERAGGADEPTQVLLDNGSGTYLDAVMALLSDQKATGYKVEGPSPSVKVVPDPGGDMGGVDSRLTLKVCEDDSQGWYTDESGNHPGAITQGTVFLGWVDDRPKVIAGETEVVEACTL